MIKIAQTFYVDKSSVRGAETVTLNAIEVYFKSVPLATANKSGITNPGVTLYLLNTSGNDVPDVNSQVQNAQARREYNEIVASGDATISTSFKFRLPVIVEAGKTYAIAVAYDGDEDFKLWTCVAGETIVGTSTVTGGAIARNVGKYFEYTVPSVNGVYDAASRATLQPLNDTDLKFKVSVSTYATDITSSAINTTYLMPSDGLEFVMYNRYHYKTSNHLNGKIGEYVYQETPVIYGPIQVSNTNVSIKTTGSINFSLLFPGVNTIKNTTLSPDPTPGGVQYIVLRNGSTTSANVDVVKVISVASNTEIIVERLPVFTNNVATFSVTAVGRLETRDRWFHDGRWWDSTSNTMNVYAGFKADMVRLTDSNANSTIRFANNTLEALTVTSGGTGYSNADSIIVSPVTNANTANAQHVNYIPNYANAVANVVTNGSGTITGISITNAGFGMTGQIVTTINTSTGSAANIVPTIGCTLRSAETNAVYGDCVVTNIPIHRMFPHVSVISNQNHSSKIVQHYSYYIKPGTEHVINQNVPAVSREVDAFSNNPTFDYDSNDGRVYILASASNEAKQANVSVKFANGTVFATKVKSSSLLEIPVTSNNAFTVPMISTDQVYNYKYIINNTALGEHKGRGKALARHVSEKVTFAEGRNAEDIIVYCDTYRPAGTRINVYARLLNRSDSDSFDDKDWTKLEIKSDNANTVSSLTDENDIIQFTYGLPQCPASVNTIAGDCITTNNSTTINGLSTAFSTDLQVNDVIKIYSPLFANTNYMISVVRTVANSSQITIDDAVLDPTIVSTSAKIDFIGRPGVGGADDIGLPFQAFTYRPNNYVVRYYDSKMSKKNGYFTFAIKTVLLSNNSSIVPKVWNMRAVGVSA